MLKGQHVQSTYFESIAAALTDPPLISESLSRTGGLASRRTSETRRK
jgi:hypothetical protein